MKKYLLLFAVLPFLWGCPVCNNKTYELPPIPDSVLALIPYKDSSTYRFKHSNGYIASFSCERQTVEEYSWNECGCADTYKYFINHTTLSCNYPLINIEIALGRYDSIISTLDIWIKNSNYSLPINHQNQIFSSRKIDSLQIGDSIYKNITVCTNYGYYYNDKPFTDSLYYNTTSGILKIFLNNGESYSIYQ